MIYTGLNRTGEIADIKAHGGNDISEVYGGIGESNPIYYKQREMVGTSPMQFKALGLPLTDYRISGNTIQNGTPSPDMPVDVVSVGEKTENLWVGTANVTTRTYEIEPYTPYTAGKYPPLGKNKGRISLTIYDSNMNQLWDNYALVWNNVTYTGNLSNAKYAKVTVYDSPFTSYFFGKTGYNYNNYIPYGYKLPITCGGVTTTVYIGAEPLHRIGEYADEVSFATGKIIRRVNPDTMQPYVTPVEKNPPVSFPTLTTAVGSNTFAVDTTVQPSSVSITGHIKPTGYGQLLDVNDVDIQDSNGTPIFIQG